MATPLTATARIVFKYDVHALPHVYRAYCAFNMVLGVPQLVDRDGITTILWTLGAQQLWDNVRPMYGAADLPAPANIVLEQRSGAIWNPVAFAVLTGIGTIGTPWAAASELTIVLRDTAFKKIRVNYLEMNAGYAGHSVDASGFGASIQLAAHQYDGSIAGANQPFRWVKSRGDNFILGSGALAGVTLDLNDKLKRARGLA